VQTAAYNLPNDDKVVQQKGAKRVMLKNSQEAKFKSTLQPISKVVLHRGAAGPEFLNCSLPTLWRTNSPRAGSAPDQDQRSRHDPRMG